MTIPEWLAERPSSLVRLLMWRNALRRSSMAKLRVLLMVLVLAAPLAPAVAGSMTASWIAYGLAKQPAAVFVLAGVLLAILAKRQRRAAAQPKRSWLGSLPVRDPVLERAALIGLTILALLEWVLAGAMVAGRAPAGVIGALILVAAAGGVAGFWAGWFLPRSRRLVVPTSRRAGTRGLRDAWATRATLVPLGFWAVGKVRWWGRPRVSAFWVALACLAVPMNDSTGAVVLGLVGGVCVGLYLALYLFAMVRVEFAASWWLAPTGIGRTRFGTATTYLALARQVAICAIVVGVAGLLEGRRVLGLAADAGAVWLVLTSLLGVLAAFIALRKGGIAASRLHRWLA